MDKVTSESQSIATLRLLQCFVLANDDCGGQPCTFFSYCRLSELDERERKVFCLTALGVYEP